MEAFEVDGTPVLLLYPTNGEVTAVQAICPHQNIPLVEGDFDGEKVLTCSAHLWQFDVVACVGINPRHSELARYPVKIEDDTVYVDITGIEAKFAQG